MSRRHEALQNTLTTATYLNQLIKPCEEVGVNIKAAVNFESANVLWDQGEMTASIRMLQDLQANNDTTSSFVHVGKSELLAKLVRLPDNISHQSAKYSVGPPNIRGKAREARRDH